MFDVEKLKKIRNPLLLVILLIGMYFPWQYQNGNMSMGDAQFAMACTASLLFFIEFVISYKTEECVAKIKITKEQDSGMYYAVLSFIVVCFITSLTGVFFYW